MNINSNETLISSGSFQRKLEEKKEQYKTFLLYLKEEFCKRRDYNEFQVDYEMWINDEDIGENLSIEKINPLNIEAQHIKIYNNFYIINCKKYFLIYDEYFSLQRKEKLESPICCISEIKYEKSEPFLIISTEKGKLYQIIFEKGININTLILKMNFEFILEIKKQLYLLSNEEGTSFYEGLIFNNNKKKLNKVIKEKIKVGMTLNSKKYAYFIYNENHRNILSFFNPKTKKIEIKKEINECFIISQNCIELIEFENKENFILLICGIKREKNGLCISKIEIEDKKAIETNFIYETYNYIPTSLLILHKINENYKILSEKTEKTYYTDFILVNGVNQDKEEKECRIYNLEGIKYKKPQNDFIKVNFSNNESKKDCEYIMNQSNINGDLLSISQDNKLNVFKLNYESLK